MAAQPFIPPNYPRSFVIGICAILSGLAAGVVSVFGYWTGINLLGEIGRLLFFVCWVVGAAMFIIFIPNAWAGKYRNLPPRVWKDQVW